MLTQQSHPKLWLLFQYFFGANKDKKRIVFSYLENNQKILEIGCSLGVVAKEFIRQPSVQYLGIDIDQNAINYCSLNLASAHMRFENISLRDLIANGEKFDYVIFANILHHVDDVLAIELIGDSKEVLQNGGKILFMEPDTLHGDESFLMKQLYKLERGEYRRSLGNLISMISDANLEIIEAKSCFNSIGMLPMLKCGRIIEILARNPVNL